MASVSGRTAEFQSGQTSFHTEQSGFKSFAPRSVLDSFVRSGNGMSSSDQKRMLPQGGILPAINGRSQDTSQKRLYLDLNYGMQQR